MLKPEKCPSCDADDNIIDITYITSTIFYKDKKCRNWLCRWLCSSCNRNKKNYERWWCGNCNYNFSSEEAGIHIMYINMKNGGCKHIELRDSDVQKAIRNRKK